MIITNPTEQQYKEVWKASRSSILQSFEWGEIKKPEWFPVRIIIDDLPVTILTRKLPLINKSFGYIPRGLNYELNETIIKQLVEYSKNIGLTHLSIDPYFESDSKNSELLRKYGLIQSGISVQPNQTNIVELVDEPTLLARLKPKYRRNIKKSQRDGCEIKVFSSGNEPLDQFYLCMESIFQRTNYVMHGKSYFQKVWSTLSQNNMAKIYLAYKDNKVVGGYLVTNDSETAYELYGGVTNEGRDVEAGYLLKWNAMIDSLSSGLKYYDHWGIAPIINGDYDKKHDLYHISKFKEGFGGRIVHYSPQLTIIFSKFYNFYKLIIWVNSILLAIKKFGR